MRLTSVCAAGLLDSGSLIETTRDFLHLAAKPTLRTALMGNRNVAIMGNKNGAC